MQLTTVPARHSALLDRPASDLAHAGVVTVPATASLGFLARTMAEHRIHAALVVDRQAGRWGWATARGMLHNHARDWTAATAQDAITEGVATLRPTASLRDALDAFLASGSTHVLLVDDAGEPLSVLADSDVVRHVAGLA